MQKRGMVVALALCTAACAAALPFIPVTPLLSVALSSRVNDDEIAKRIVELEIKKDWVGLAGFASQQMERDPSDMDWTVILAFAQIQQKEYKPAIALLERAIARSPEEIDPRNLLGEAYRLSGDPIRAAQILERAITIHSNTAQTRFLLGEAYRDDNRLERAKESYRDAILIDGEFSPAWSGLAGVLARTGPREEFEEAIKALLKLEPELARQILNSAKPTR
ncbi:MAG: tetratricopeptide repeat protein [Betaproteobacteria bacterium]|nr:tetratricopeptide repeat protein [Betaproteobacteria bacterium]